MENTVAQFVFIGLHRPNPTFRSFAVLQFDKTFRSPTLDGIFKVRHHIMFLRLSENSKGYFSRLLKFRKVRNVS